MTTESGPEKRGRGRPPKNGLTAMSDAERQRQYRTRLKKSGGSVARRHVHARRTLEFLLSCVTRLRSALEAGDSARVRDAFLGVENNVGLLHLHLGAAVPDIGGKLVRLGTPPAAAPAPASSVDLEALKAILAHSGEKLGVANMQVEWLHEGITPETPAAITGPAWQLRFAMADWEGTIDFVGAVLEGRGAEVPDLWTRPGEPARRRRFGR